MNTPDTEWEKTTIAMCDDIIEAITNRIKWKDGVLNIFDVVEPHVKTLLSYRDTYWKERMEELNRKNEWRMFKIADELAKLQGWLGTVAGSEVDSTLMAKAPSKEVRDSKALHTSVIMTAKKKIKEIQTLNNENNLK